MAASSNQKIDYLLKKIGYTASKTGIAEDGSISGTKKSPSGEAIASPLVVPSDSVWADSSLIPTTPPGSDSATVKVYLAGTSGLRMTVDSTVSGSRSFIAYTTYNNTGSGILGNWIDTQFGSDYIIKVYKGDPNSGGVQLSAAGSGSSDGWFFDYSSGVLNFNDTNVPSGVSDTNIYIVGYRYIGKTGVVTPGGISSITQLNVSGIATIPQLQAGTVNASGIITATAFHTGASGSAVRILGNTISGPATLTIDPAAVGDNTGTVVIAGSLQVDGTTTTVNSTAVSVNEAIFELSDVTSKRTVLTAANAGATTLTLDSVVGINTGDSIGGTSALTPGGGGLTTAITGYNAGAKTVTIASGTSAGIATNTQLTITHAYDTNTDKGISFNYNTGVGTANNKKGFFGYLDTAPTSTSDAPANSWTYIPEVAITADKVSGVRGFLDVKGIYYQGTSSGAGDWYSSGAAYFDANGKLTSTVNPAGGITTSNYVMTTNASGIPTWTTTLDGGTF